MDKNKPIKDWTLAECKKYCDSMASGPLVEATDAKTHDIVYSKSHDCHNCFLFKQNICARNAFNWNIDILTDGEKAIMRACGAKFATLNNIEKAKVKLWREEPIADTFTYYLPGGEEICIIDRSLFPSLSGGDCIELED